LAFLSAVLLVLVLFATLIGIGPAGFLFRNISGFITFVNIAQYAAFVAALGLFVIAFMISIPLALRPAGSLRKLINVLPFFLLIVTLICVITGLMGIGTVGTLSDSPGLGNVSFIVVCIAVSGLLAAVAVAIATATTDLGERISQTAMRVMAITGLPSLIAWLGLANSAVILLTSVSGTAAQAPNGAQRQPGGPPRAGNFSNQFAVGGGLATVFAVIELVGVVGGLRAQSATSKVPSPATPQFAHPDGAREVGKAVGAFVVVGVVALGAMQLVPVPHENPPVRTMVQWDSPQTEALWNRACADCHSNETKWPWYSYVAPASWLTVSHIQSGRRKFNISEPLTGREADDAGEQIRDGNMPLPDYQILHPEARLTDSERDQLDEGLANSLSR
jgi:hypothetical protein